MAAASSSQERIPLVQQSEGNELTPEKERRLFNKLTHRVVLLCMGIAFVSYVDRCNVGYAANDLCSDLRLTHSEYGTAVSLFYIGYIISQPTSNVCLRKFGAPTWLAFIVCAWGCVATASAFIQSLWQFYIIRILLGLAEGGTFPGIFYYLGLFFPDAYIEEPYASVQASLSFSMLLSSPIAAGLLGSDGLYGTRGWRNLFFVEGLMPIAYAIMLFIFLPKSLESASFLEPAEKEWLLKHQIEHREVTTFHLWEEAKEIMKSVKFWLLTFCWGMTVGVFVVLLYWISLIIQDGLKEDKDEGTCGSGGSSVVAVALTTIPYALNGFLCISIRTYTRHVKNRTSFAAVIFTVSSIFLLSWVWTRELSFEFGFLSLTAAITIWSCGLTFVIGVISTIFRSELRSTVVALANGLGSLGSFVLPIAIGIIVDNYGYHYAIPFSAFVVMLAALSIFLVKDPLLIAPQKEEEQVHHESVCV